VVFELWTWMGIVSGMWGIGGGIERRKRRCYHRRGKPAGDWSDMTWQGDLVFATQFAHTICVSVMDACHTLDLTRDPGLLRASCNDALEDRYALTVGCDGEGQIHLGRVEFDGALCTLQRLRQQLSRR